MGIFQQNYIHQFKEKANGEELDAVALGPKDIHNWKVLVRLRGEAAAFLNSIDRCTIANFIQDLIDRKRAVNSKIIISPIIGVTGKGIKK